MAMFALRKAKMIIRPNCRSICSKCNGNPAAQEEAYCIYMEPSTLEKMMTHSINAASVGTAILFLYHFVQPSEELQASVGKYFEGRGEKISESVYKATKVAVKSGVQKGLKDCKNKE